MTQENKEMRIFKSAEDRTAFYLVHDLEQVKKAIVDAFPRAFSNNKFEELYPVYVADKWFPTEFPCLVVPYCEYIGGPDMVGCRFMPLSMLRLSDERPAPSEPSYMLDIRSYYPGQWYEVKSKEELKAFFESRLPAIRAAVKELGWGIGVHGSMERDLDLIALPWTNEACDKNKLAQAIGEAACGMAHHEYQWEVKPNGRLATSISCCWTPWPEIPGSGHIDLSIMEGVR
jgi:hypothetical protein